MRSLKPVRNGPGFIVATSAPNSCSSAFMVSAMASTACLDAECRPVNGLTFRPSRNETQMMRPAPRLAICFAMLRVSRSRPVTFTSNWCRCRPP